MICVFGICLWYAPGLVPFILCFAVEFSSHFQHSICSNTAAHHNGLFDRVVRMALSRIRWGFSSKGYEFESWSWHSLKFSSERAVAFVTLCLFGGTTPARWLRTLVGNHFDPGLKEWLRENSVSWQHKCIFDSCAMPVCSSICSLHNMAVLEKALLRHQKDLKDPDKGEMADRKKGSISYLIVEVESSRQTPRTHIHVLFHDILILLTRSNRAI